MREIDRGVHDRFAGRARQVPGDEASVDLQRVHREPSMGKGIRRVTTPRGRPVLPAIGSLGEQIHAARLSLGLTQAQLGGEPYTATYISALERGRLTNPSPEAIAFLERRLKLERGALARARSAGVPDAITAAIELVARSQPTSDDEAQLRESALVAPIGLRLRRPATSSPAPSMEQTVLSPNYKTVRSRRPDRPRGPQLKGQFWCFGVCRLTRVFEGTRARKGQNCPFTPVRAWLESSVLSPATKLSFREHRRSCRSHNWWRWGRVELPVQGP